MLNVKKFKRTIEDFICENCSFSIQGSGYTNHCPKCLHSKHVDINPGDRAQSCKGLMAPVGFFIKNGKDVIQHRCKKCGVMKNNKVAQADDLNALMQIKPF